MTRISKREIMPPPPSKTVHTQYFWQYHDDLASILEGKATTMAPVRSDPWFREHLGQLQQHQPVLAEPTFWDDVQTVDAAHTPTPDVVVIGRFLEQLTEGFRLRWTEYATSTMLRILLHRTRTLEVNQQALAQRLALLEGSSTAPSVEIDWIILVSAVNRVAEELDWRCEIHVEEDENTVAVRVPTEMTDLVAETTFSFYEKLASTMGGEVMQSLTFDFQVLE